MLIQKYLLSLGYLDSVTKIEQETNISLDKYDTADNLDLYMVVMEYEHYYEMKFNKPPKLCKVANDSSTQFSNQATVDQMRKAALKTKQINSTINKNPESNSQPPYPSKRTYRLDSANFKKKDSVAEKNEKS